MVFIHNVFELHFIEIVSIPLIQLVNQVVYRAIMDVKEMCEEKKQLLDWEKNSTYLLLLD